MSCSLTLGVFDGVHKGHQALLNQLEGHRIAVTFVNHPHHILQGQAPSLLTPIAHRIELLKTLVDHVQILEFSHGLSLWSAEEFLYFLHNKFQFNRLILGHDAKLGHQGRGQPDLIKEIGKNLGFEVAYLQPVAFEGQIISSSLIRKALQRSDLHTVSSMLGRPYSIKGPVIAGHQIGRKMGTATMNFSVKGLEIPPYGVYAVSVGGKKAVANLGLAPTLHADREPLLEVHILDNQGDCYGQSLEVVFESFMRPEVKFPSLEALKEQIAKDISSRLSMQK